MAIVLLSIVGALPVSNYTFVHVLLKAVAGAVRQAKQVELEFLVGLYHGLIADRVFSAQLLLNDGDYAFLLGHSEELHDVVVKLLLLGHVARVGAISFTFLNLFVEVDGIDVANRITVTTVVRVSVVSAVLSLLVFLFVFFLIFFNSFVAETGVVVISVSLRLRLALEALSNASSAFSLLNWLGLVG